MRPLPNYSSLLLCWPYLFIIFLHATSTHAAKQIDRHYYHHQMASSFGSTAISTIWCQQERFCTSLQVRKTNIQHSVNVLSSEISTNAWVNDLWTTWQPAMFWSVEWHTEFTKPKNEIRKNALWRWNSTSGSNAEACHHSGTFMCVTTPNFSQIKWSAVELQWFNHFTLWGPFWGAFCANGFQSWETHPHPVSTMPTDVGPWQVFFQISEKVFGTGVVWQFGPTLRCWAWG